MEILDRNECAELCAKGEEEAFAEGSGIKKRGRPRKTVEMGKGAAPADGPGEIPAVEAKSSGKSGVESGEGIPDKSGESTPNEGGAERAVPNKRGGSRKAAARGETESCEEAGAEFEAGSGETNGAETQGFEEADGAGMQGFGETDGAETQGSGETDGAGAQDFGETNGAGTQAAAKGTVSEVQGDRETKEAAPKKRGRPRKHPVVETEPGAVPRKRGRPRIHPVKEEDICGAAFRKQGRVPKNGWKAEELLQGEAVNGAWETVAKLLLEGEAGMSIREIAKAANISRDMVYRYLKDEGFNRYLDALIDREIQCCEAAIWNRLKEMCMGGDLSAIKFYFDLRGKRAKEPEESAGAVVQIIDDVPDLSPEKLKEIYGPLAGEELTEMETDDVG